MDDDRPLPLELPAAALSWLQAVMTALQARASDPRAKREGRQTTRPRRSTVRSRMSQKWQDRKQQISTWASAQRRERPFPSTANEPRRPILWLFRRQVFFSERMVRRGNPRVGHNTAVAHSRESMRAARLRRDVERAAEYRGFSKPAYLAQASQQGDSAAG